MSYKIFLFDSQERKSSRRFLTVTIPSLTLSRRRETIVSQAGEQPHPSQFSVNRLGFPGIFSSLLFALYASCNFMFLETNIAHHSVPYFLRRSYFCLLLVFRGSCDLHIRRKVVPVTFASKS